MKHLKGLYEELKIEIEKAINCEYYSGVVFVHPDDLEDVVEVAKGYTVFQKYDPKRKTFTFDSGACLILDNLERNGSGRYPHFDYAGCQLTSILIHCQCFNGYKGNNDNFIMYMLSRNRSQSKFSSRVVIL